MKLSEALRIIDDTVGMFRTFAEEKIHVEYHYYIK